MQYKATGKDELSTPELVRFLVIALGLGMGIQLLGTRHGDGHDAKGLMLLTMWCPAVAAFLSGPASRGRAKAALKRFPFKWAAVGIAAGLAPTLIQNLLFAVTGTGHWNAAQFERDPAGHGIRAVHHLGLALGVGPQSWPYFVLNMAVTLVLASVVLGALGGLGEELGWRAVLQPELTRRFGTFRGTLLVGVIWAYWHLPVNLAGYNDAKHPIWTSFVLFPLGVVCLAFTFGWLATHSQSVWPAAMAHAANNVLAAGFVLAPNDWAMDQLTTLPALAIVAFFAARGLLKPRSAAPEAGVARPATAMT